MMCPSDFLCEPQLGLDISKMEAREQRMTISLQPFAERDKD